MRTNLSKIIMFGVSLAFVIVACQKKDDGGSNGNTAATPAANTNGTATTPQPCNYAGAPGCPGQQGQNPYGYNPNYGYNPYSYNGNYYGYYYNNQYYGYNMNQANSWYYGSWYWPTQYNQNYGNNGCMPGYVPTCSPGFGVACAPSTYFSYYNVSYYGYGQNSPYNINPQVSYQGASACPSTAAQSCDTRANNCPSGSTCQAVGGGSIYGMCVKNP